MYKRLAIYSHVIISLLFLSTFIAIGQEPARQTPPEVKINPAVFDAYTGQYEDAQNLAGTIFSFFREGDKFYVRVTNQDKIEIFAASESKFFLKDPPAECEFIKDVNGHATGMVWNQGAKFTTKKISDTPQADTRIPYK